MTRTKSEIYAERDGIEIEPGIGRGGKTVNVYLIPCAECGEIVRKQIYNGDKLYYCDTCMAGIAKQKRAKSRALEDAFYSLIETPKERAYQKAVDKIKAQVKNFVDYEDAIRLCARRAEDYDSIPEAMVAIELTRLGYRTIPQQKIGKYRVDFCLPDQRLVIEVDGKLYHQDKYKGDREGAIQMSLGIDWDIIHIPAELIADQIQKLQNIINLHLPTRAYCNTGEIQGW